MSRNKKSPLILVLLTVEVCLLLLGLRSRERGGTLIRADFRRGFDLYVREGFETKSALLTDVDADALRLWKVTDPQMKQEVYEICSRISCYREMDPAEVPLAGPGDGGSAAIFPRAYFDCGDIGYAIEIINWAYYALPGFDSVDIKEEAGGEPILTLRRVGLGATQQGQALETGPDRIRFLTSGLARDMGGKFRFLWYSRLSQEDLDRLLELLYQVDGTCAEVFE